MLLIVYLAAVLGTLAIGAGAIVTLEIARPGGEWNSNTTTIIIGLCTMVVTQLLGIIKSIGNGQQIQEVKQNASVAAEKASVAAMKAEEAASVAIKSPQKVDVTIKP